MKIIPAIDIIDGFCVRLTKGDFKTQKKYFDNPLKVARMWKSNGAEWIHMVDLDGARTGKVQNLKIAVDIKNNIDIKVQYGGGIRNFKVLKEILDAGIDRAILGSRAVEERSFLEKSIESFGERIILSLDFGKNGLIFKSGWQRKTKINIFNFVKGLEKLRICEIIITDISRDGTLKGLNLDIIRKILKKSKINIILAGGISGIKDIIKAKELEREGISGVIIGKALYEGRIDLKKAIQIGVGS